MTELAETVWRISPSSAALFQQLDEELLLFDLLTWRTHLLNSAAAELVRLIEEKESSSSTLAEALAPGDAGFRLEVENLLGALLDLGIVESAER